MQIDELDEVSQATDGISEDDQDSATPPEESSEDNQLAEENEVVVTIGDEAPPAEEEDGPGLVNKLRKLNREKDRAVREKDRELQELKKQVVPPTAAPAAAITKPTLAGCDYDEEKYEKDLEAFHVQQRAENDAKQKREAEQKAQNDAWQAKLDAHGKAKAALKVVDYEEAEDNVRQAFSVTQQGILISGPENSAIVAYALGKNPTKLKELAAITDPVKFSFAIAKLETQLKVTSRTVPPPPEGKIKGSGIGIAAGSSDKKLDQLREEAARTGNASKVVAYKRQLKEKQK